MSWNSTCKKTEFSTITKGLFHRLESLVSFDDDHMPQTENEACHKYAKVFKVT